MVTSVKPLHVSLLAVPEGAISTLTGLYDVLNAFAMLAGQDDALPKQPPFEVTFETPQQAPLHRQAEAFSLALETMLIEYRYLIAVAQNI